MEEIKKGEVEVQERQWECASRHQQKLLFLSGDIISSIVSCIVWYRLIDKKSVCPFPLICKPQRSNDWLCSVEMMMEIFLAHRSPEAQNSLAEIDEPPVEETVRNPP